MAVKKEALGVAPTNVTANEQYVTFQTIAGWYLDNTDNLAQDWTYIVQVVGELRKGKLTDWNALFKAFHAISHIELPDNLKMIGIQLALKLVKIIFRKG
jgi:hypothetical protein